MTHPIVAAMWQFCAPNIMDYGELTVDQQVPLVLVADDDEYMRALLQRTMEREGFTVASATDGQEAIEQAQRLHPDLILMDVQMPDVDGFEAVRRLRENPDTMRTPIIIVSAAARQPTDVAHGLGIGADDYLFKPFNVAELAARAHSKIRSRRMEDQLKRHTEELEALVRIGSELNQGLALGDLADRILAATLEQLPASSAILALVKAGQITLERHGGVDAPNGAALDLSTLPGCVLQRGEAILIKDVHEDNRISAIFNGSSCRSGIATPLKHQGEITGVLVLGDHQSARFTSSHLRLLRSIAEQATLAVRNAQLYTQLQDYAQGLEGMVQARTAALQSAQMQLMRAERLAALGTLAAGIAHEVNNPLQPILINLEMALEDIDGNVPANRELLEFSRQEVRRISGIVSRLLDFARPAAPQLAPLDLSVVINEVLTLVGKQLEHSHVEVITSLQATHRIFGSADQLKQVLLNLIVNAIDAMPKGGQLTIHTSERDGTVIWQVRDTGMGIPPDKIMQVFDPFYTTKAEGTGLGLSVSYGIIESHEGQITVESTPGVYTEFTIRLPYWPKPEQAA